MSTDLRALARRFETARRRPTPKLRAPDALADKSADLLGNVLLVANRLDLDLAAAVRRRWRFDPGSV